MEFGLLGPVEVWVDGRRLALGPPKRRGVLAALGLELGQVVTLERLIDVIWPAAPPASARSVVFAHVSRLREVLAAGGARRHGVELATEGAGYALHADPEKVDAERFRMLCRQAGTIGDDEKQVALLDQALRLWRGPALSGAFAEEVRARLSHGLDEARLAARLDRIDGQLRLGQHALVLVDAAELVDAFPLQERPTAQLMLALHRAGRTADALHLHSAFRRRLVDELGLDPGPKLRVLHETILRADPGLLGEEIPDPGLDADPALGPDVEQDQGVRARRSARAGDSAGRPRGRVPAQLPRGIVGFTGRARELAELHRLLDAGQREGTGVVIFAVSGTAGVGKTALALQWAHTVADRFPDGQLYVNLRGFQPDRDALTPAEAMRGLLDGMTPPSSIPAGLDAQAALYRSLLAGLRVLVVLDDARDAEQVRPLLPGSPGCAVVVTSRSRVPGLVAVDGAQPLALDLFTLAESGDLLVRRLGAGRVAPEADAAVEIIERCARLPLAVAIAAARAATHPELPLAAVAAELRHGLDSFANRDSAIDIRAVLASSYRAVDPAAARLFRLLGLHRGADLTAAVAASVGGVPAARARHLLAELVDANLVSERAPGRYGFHDLLRAFAAERAADHETGAERRAATRRMLDHYLHSAYAADRMLYPHRDPITIAPAAAGVTVAGITDHAQALEWFTAQHPVLLTAVEQAATSGYDRHTWQLAWVLSNYLNLRGYWHDQATVQHAALDAAHRLGDLNAQADAHRGLGRARDMLGDADQACAHLERALDLFGAVGDDAGRAITLINLARMHERQGRLDVALHHDMLSLNLFQSIGHDAGQARALNNVGWDLAQHGRYAEALTICRQALALHQRLDNKHGRATASTNIGMVHGLLGDYDRAVDCYRGGVDMFRHAADRPGEAGALVGLGDAHLAAGRVGAARDAWRGALRILEELGDPNARDVRVRLDRN